MGFVIIAMFFAVPLISLVAWILYLVKYCKAKSENKLNPDIHSKEEMKALKSNLIISSVIAFVLAAIVIGLIALFAVGIAYM